MNWGDKGEGELKDGTDDSERTTPCPMKAKDLDPI
jgi:hypothetical protein